MGQRFQVVIKTPAEYWNDKNPNNKEGEILVYHYQWLWGNFAVWRLGNLVYAIQELIKNHDSGFSKKYPISYDELIESAFKWVNYKDLTCQNSCSKYYDDEFKLSIGETWENCFKHFDNNNGIFFLNIKDKNNFEYCFYNPEGNESDESRQEKLLDVEEYLKDYMGDTSDLKKDKEFLNSLDILKNLSVMKKFPKIESWFVKQEKKITA